MPRLSVLGPIVNTDLDMRVCVPPSSIHWSHLIMNLGEMREDERKGRGKEEMIYEKRHKLQKKITLNIPNSNFWQL